MKKLSEIKYMFGLLYVDVIINDQGVPVPDTNVKDRSEGWKFYTVPSENLEEKLAELNEYNRTLEIPVIAQVHDDTIYVAIRYGDYPYGEQITQ